MPMGVKMPAALPNRLKMLPDRPVASRDADGYWSYTQYDLLGDATASFDARGKVTRQLYDPEQRLVQQADPDGAATRGLVIDFADTPENGALFQFLQEQWTQILNVDVVIQVIDSKTRSARFTAMDYDLLPGGWPQDYPELDNWLVGLWNTWLLYPSPSPRDA